MMLTKKVCIVGGGVSGLSTVKSLNFEPTNFEIDLYDIKSQLGGVWNYFSRKTEFHNDKEIIANKIYDYSPIYRDLETNIVKELMKLAGLEFNTDKEFPRHFEVLGYLKEYIKTLGPFNNHLNHLVTKVEKKTGNLWSVSVKDLVTGEERIKEYDAVVIANGHFNDPFYPDITGLQEWLDKDSNSFHAKFFDDIQLYKEKTVVVIGGFSSGSDIALHLSKTANHIMVSIKEGDLFGKFDDETPYVSVIQEIGSVDYKNKLITLKNGETYHADNIIVCTGYYYDIPFLKLPLCHKTYVSDIYKQIFYIKDPTLCFTGLMKNVKPFPLSEAQASLISRYLSGRLKLPTTEEMYKDYKEEFDLSNGGSDFHNFKTKQVEYTNYCQNLIKEQGLESGFNSLVFDNRRLEINQNSGKLKDKRILEVNRQIVRDRNSK